jgi:hypothetical protein
VGITFPEHLRALAATSKNPVIRDSEALLNEYLTLHEDGKSEYGWLGLSDEAFAEKGYNNPTVESLNALYWNDFARTLEAYLVVTRWRALELVQGTIGAITMKQVLTPAILCRSLLELVTQSIMTVGPMPTAVHRAAAEWNDRVMMSEEMENALGRGLLGSRQVDKSDRYHQTNILTIIQKVARQPGWEMLAEVYARFCEVAHPNMMGNARFWTNTVRGNSNGSHIRLLRREQVSGDTVDPILTDTLWCLGWAAQNVHICLAKGSDVVGFITRRFPHDPANAA